MPKKAKLPTLPEIVVVYDNILDDIESHVARKKALPQYLLFQLQSVRDLLNIIN